MPAFEPNEKRIRALVRAALQQHLDSSSNDPARGAGGAPTAGSPLAKHARRHIIDETVISALEEGSRLPVPAGTLVTPLGRDAARARRIELQETSKVGSNPKRSGGSGQQGKRKVAIGADHGGMALKALLIPHLEGEGFEVIDAGPFDQQAVDYPDYAYAVARLVSEGRAEAGIMIDGVGIGSCMAANKVPGVRAGLCYDVSTARNAREHNHANYLTLGGQLIGPLLAKQIVSAWLATPFGPGRHASRVEKINDIERRYSKR